MSKEVYVDPKRCQGHARCWSIAPETFGIDEEGFGFVLPGRGGSYDEEGVKKAIKNCPERAIKVRDLEEGV